MKKKNLIEKYFTDTLSHEERILFDKLLQNDQEFKDEFIFQKELKQSIAHQQRETIKKTLKGFEDKLSKKKVFTLKNWLAAASVLLVFSLGYFAFNKYNSSQPEKLFTSNFAPYENVVHPTVRSPNDESIESKAFSAYDSGMYYKAINLFNSVENKDADYIRFYKAMSFLALKKNQEAIDLLLPLATTPDASTSKFKWHGKANWYLGLAYLNNQEIDKAISQFNVVVIHPDCEYKKEAAKEIISLIKSD
ncbi:MAG: hypothetical protein U5K51_01765 [Flavobacteriaceae bacterium]|nr:hypothetical protein [Flavobacteriaceae bacterium]